MHFLSLFFLLCIQLHVMVLLAACPDLIQETREQLKHLTKNSYAFVPLGLSEEEMGIFDKIEMDECEQYDRYGNLELIKVEIPEILRRNGNFDENLIQSVTDSICKIVSNVTAAFGKQTAWVCIRTNIPNPYFDVPRWHVDGYFYSPNYGPQYKFAAALKGRQTLFHPLNPDSRNEYFSYMRDSWSTIDTTNIQEVFRKMQEDRIVLNQMFDVAHSETAPKGCGAIFIAGDESLAALHSEAKIDSQRLFISILPGQECEIKELENRWKSAPIVVIRDED